MRLQRVPYRAGDVVIKQGDEGDYFYVIVSGKCVVTRETPLNRDGIKLAELSVGDTFGEEALIAEAKRNATVTMLTDGVLMRLNKQDFRELMNEPLLQWATMTRPARSSRAAAAGSTCGCPANTRTSPSKAPSTSRCISSASSSRRSTEGPYVVYCDTGRRSSAAAYILVERGFDAYVLRGGLTTAASRSAGRPS